MDATLLQVLSALVGGGVITAIISAWANRGKNHSDITKSNIETALRLKNEAVEEYNTAETKLKEARRLLDEVQAELDVHKQYIEYLTRILDRLNADYCEFDIWRKKRSKNGNQS